MSDAARRWDYAYENKGSAGACWFESSPGASLAMIERAGLETDAIIDVGGGAFRLAAELIRRGYHFMVGEDDGGLPGQPAPQPQGRAGVRGAPQFSWRFRKPLKPRTALAIGGYLPSRRISLAVTATRGPSAATTNTNYSSELFSAASRAARWASSKSPVICLTICPSRATTAIVISSVPSSPKAATTRSTSV